MVAQGTYDDETVVAPARNDGGAAAHENAAIFEFQDDSAAQSPEGLTITYGNAGPDLWTRAVRARQWVTKRANNFNQKHDLSATAQRTGQVVETSLVSGWERLRKVVGNKRTQN